MKNPPQRGQLVLVWRRAQSWKQKTRWCSQVLSSRRACRMRIRPRPALQRAWSLGSRGGVALVELLPNEKPPRAGLAVAAGVELFAALPNENPPLAAGAGAAAGAVDVVADAGVEEPPKENPPLAAGAGAAAGAAEVEAGVDEPPNENPPLAGLDAAPPKSDPPADGAAPVDEAGVDELSLLPPPSLKDPKPLNPPPPELAAVNEVAEAAGVELPPKENPPPDAGLDAAVLLAPPKEKPPEEAAGAAALSAGLLAAGALPKLNPPVEAGAGAEEAGVEVEAAPPPKEKPPVEGAEGLAAPPNEKPPVGVDVDVLLDPKSPPPEAGVVEAAPDAAGEPKSELPVLEAPVDRTERKMKSVIVLKDAMVLSKSLELTSKRERLVGSTSCSRRVVVVIVVGRSTEGESPTAERHAAELLSQSLTPSRKPIRAILRD